MIPALNAIVWLFLGYCAACVANGDIARGWDERVYGRYRVLCWACCLIMVALGPIALLSVLVIIGLVERSPLRFRHLF